MHLKLPHQNASVGKAAEAGIQFHLHQEGLPSEIFSPTLTASGEEPEPFQATPKGMHAHRLVSLIPHLPGAPAQHKRMQRNT